MIEVKEGTEKEMFTILIQEFSKKCDQFRSRVEWYNKLFVSDEREKESYEIVPLFNDLFYIYITYEHIDELDKTDNHFFNEFLWGEGHEYLRSIWRKEMPNNEVLFKKMVELYNKYYGKE